MSARISAVIPAYNAMPDVMEAVESVLAQSLPVAEVVVVDDRSSDGTGDAVRARFGDRVRVLRGTFGSASASRNAGWRAATGDWIAFLDADDLWKPNKLAVAIQRLAAAPHADWYFSDGSVSWTDGREYPSLLELYIDLEEPYCGKPVAELCEVNFILTSSVVVRRSALEAAGGFDETLSHAEDVDLWIKLSRGGYATGSRDVLVHYRGRESGLSAQTANRNIGAATMFSRLAADRTLDPALRRAARRRASLHHYKLAVAALREGRSGEARSSFAKAWAFPDFITPVLLGYATSLMPHGLVQRLRGRRAVGAVAAPMISPRRVRLAGFAAPPAGGTAR